MHQPSSKCYLELEEIRQDFSFLWQTQAGCRQIQKAIDDYGYNCVRAILEKFIIEIEDITVHSFGNYIFQKLMTVINEADLAKVFAQMKHGIISIAKKPYGMRSLQAFVAAIKSYPTIITEFIEVLNPHLSNLIVDANASHIIQKSLIHFDEAFTAPIVEAIAKNCIVYAKDMHACCVVQKALDNKDIFEGSLKYQIAMMLMANTLELITHPYGNYVTQLLIKLKPKKISEGVINLIKLQIVELSCDKFASHPIELAFEAAGTEGKKQMLDSLCHAASIKKVLFDQYGNYVLQKILKLSSNDERKKIIDQIKLHIDELSLSSHGKKVCEKLTKCYKEYFN